MHMNSPTCGEPRGPYLTHPLPNNSLPQAHFAPASHIPNTPLLRPRRPFACSFPRILLHANIRRCRPFDMLPSYASFRSCVSLLTSRRLQAPVPLCPRNSNAQNEEPTDSPTNQSTKLQNKHPNSQAYQTDTTNRYACSMPRLPLLTKFRRLRALDILLSNASFSSCIFLLATRRLQTPVPLSARRSPAQKAKSLLATHPRPGGMREAIK